MSPRDPLVSLSLLLPLLVLQTGSYIRLFDLGARDQIQATFPSPLHSKSSLSPYYVPGNSKHRIKKNNLEFSSIPRETKVRVNSQINVQSKRRSVPWRQKNKAVYFRWGNQQRSSLPLQRWGLNHLGKLREKERAQGGGGGGGGSEGDTMTNQLTVTYGLWVGKLSMPLNKDAEGLSPGCKEPDHMICRPHVGAGF